MEIFKLLKYKLPKSLSELFVKSTRELIQTLNLPNIHLDKSKENFVFSGSLHWNDMVDHIFETCIPLSSGPNQGIIIAGSSRNSDYSASTASIKAKVKIYILAQQEAGDQYW